MLRDAPVLLISLAPREQEDLSMESSLSTVRQVSLSLWEGWRLSGVRPSEGLRHLGGRKDLGRQSILEGLDALRGNGGS